MINHHSMYQSLRTLSSPLDFPKELIVLVKVFFWVVLPVSIVTAPLNLVDVSETTSVGPVNQLLHLGGRHYFVLHRL